MKNNLLICLLFLLPLTASTQTGSYDTIAIFILDHMSDVIGDLGSCSYTLNTSHDVLSDVGLGLITQTAVHEVKMVGPDKMQINSIGDKGHRGFWYNGEQVAYYFYDENNYALVEAPSTILETIDTMNQRYGIDFPAADFFYPGFTDDLMQHNDQIAYLGTSNVGGKDCFHIIATSKEMSVQFWIANDATTLPAKMLIMYFGKADASQYEAIFSDWNINPQIPESVFEFLPPPGAKDIAIMRKN
ncbi:MAG TPA: DUF2092 domain-containing protein [Saprospiraceae bacterium]|nr:DUF2092 domain-containing protein [Saprospiraceae bacterium]